VDRTPDAERLASAREILKLASRIVRLDDDIESEPEALSNPDLSPLMRSIWHSRRTAR
jgi:hypothetical protein